MNDRKFTLTLSNLGDPDVTIVDEIVKSNCGRLFMYKEGISQAGDISYSIRPVTMQDKYRLIFDIERDLKNKCGITIKTLSCKIAESKK